ncbi:glycoside hydrolase family 16 protein [Nocardioides piscis]|uniref:Glycoside hydrolase family 16 protein n=1 Tax=Nocardioides piscis TaxID=2714938 RepID=A0A6G7YCK2_9ACTN|nr:glycoside hydrolase family 16 protein [Nocardioides piscis]QIK74490.1 glycoside hydrolase family 16 protein [Nocardioides piscis]
MSHRALAGSLAALLMPTSLLMVSVTTSADAAQSPTSNQQLARKAKSKAKLSALPQIVQQGKKPASASSAKAALVAKIKPAKAGRPVVLQVQKGKTWKTAGKTKLTKKGLAEFGAPISKGGKPLKYRVTAGKFKGAAPVKSKPVSTSKWLDATWTDEFSSSTLNPAWIHRSTGYEPTSLRECSRGDAKAVSVGGGTVKLSVIKDPARLNEKCVAKKDGKSTGSYAYRLLGHIGTEGSFSFKYGFAAARIKMHKSRGQHGGFWMQPTGVTNKSSNNPKDTGAEIDIIEYFGDKHPEGGLTSFIYSQNSSGAAVKTGSWIKDSKSFLKNRRDGWSKNYHVFSVEWTPSAYIFRIDGQETWRTKVGVSGQQQFPILSLLASDYEISQGGDSKLPQTMAVDWVRVWQA